MQPNKTNLTAAAIFAFVFMFIGGVIGWKIKPCPTCIGTATVSVTDSTAPAKDTGVVSVDHVPTKVGVKKYRTSAKNAQVVFADYTQDSIMTSGSANLVFTDYTNCLDTNTFKLDTSVVDNFKASVTATVTGNEIIGMQVNFQNFKPEKWKVINTKTTVEKKQALVKVFPELYARANFNAVTATGGGAGGGASFVVNDRHLVGIDAGANKSLGQPISGEAMLRYGFKIHLGK